MKKCIDYSRKVAGYSNLIPPIRSSNSSFDLLTLRKEKKRKGRKENRLKKEKREKGNPLLGGKLIPSWNSNFQQSPSPISSRVSTRFLLVSLSLLDEALIVSDAPLIAEVIFLSRGRRLRDKPGERAESESDFAFKGRRSISF